MISRFNQDKEAQDQIQVDFKYSPKSRTLYDLQQKNQNIKIPIVAISVGGFRRNSNRVVNNIEGAWYKDTQSPRTSAWAHLLQPIPIDITVNMSIIARFQQDVDQILTNFIPYCDPYVVVSWKWPYIIPWADFEIRSHIKWNEDVSFQYPTDISNTQSYRVIADTSFTIESWMFKNQPPDGKSIYVIDTSFTAVSAMNSYASMKSYENEDNTDFSTNYTVISARPQLTFITPFYTYLSGEDNFTCYGFMLDYVKKAYLSAVDFNMFDATQNPYLSAGVTWNNPFSGYPLLSSIYTGFSGIEIANSGYNINDKNTMQFTLVPQITGLFDLIVLNEAGYGQLTKDSIRNNNDLFEYPCTSGVEVKW